MREERGHLAGNIVITEPYTLWGTVAGTVVALNGSKFYMRGSIYGDLECKPGGRVHVFGNISGSISVEAKSKLILSGVVGGDVVNHGGRLYIEATGQVMGTVKAKAGETKIEPGAKCVRSG